MAVKFITNPKLFIGASTDSKPSGSDVPVGSVFIESDTDALFRTTDDGTTWVQIDSLTRPVAVRNSGVLHRNGISSADKVADFGDASVTLANVAGTQGSLNANTLHYMTAIPGNRWGPCKVNTTIDSLTTTADAVNTHVIACTIAQATGAEWYDLFLSTDTAPKWVGRVTEAQRATGGEILTVGAYTAGASAGVINVGIVGTGIQSDNAVWAQNNAYRPATVTAINCAGRSKAHILAKLALTDLRSAPALSLVAFLANQVSTGDWHQARLEPLSLLGGLGQSLEQDFTLDVDGSTGLVVLIDAISGQGAAASVWVELS